VCVRLVPKENSFFPWKIYA